MSHTEDEKLVLIIEYLKTIRYKEKDIPVPHMYMNIFLTLDLDKDFRQEAFEHLFKMALKWKKTVP